MVIIASSKMPDFLPTGQRPFLIASLVTSSGMGTKNNRSVNFLNTDTQYNVAETIMEILVTNKL